MEKARSITTDISLSGCERFPRGGKFVRMKKEEKRRGQLQNVKKCVDTGNGLYQAYLYLSILGR